MTTYNDMIKADLNDLLPENLRCKNASQLKKMSKASLIEMLGAPRCDAGGSRRTREAAQADRPRAARDRRLPCDGHRLQRLRDPRRHAGRQHDLGRRSGHREGDRPDPEAGARA